MRALASWQHTWKTVNGTRFLVGCLFKTLHKKQVSFEFQENSWKFYVFFWELLMYIIFSDFCFFAEGFFGP